VVVEGLFDLLALLGHLDDLEDLGGVDLLVEGQLASLSEGFAAARVGAGVWSLASVSVGVFFEVLG